MCGIIGVVSKGPVNQLLYDGLLVLQHRGQDAAGIVTCDGNTFYMHKNNGLVQDVFQTRHMRSLQGNAGIAHVRYPTAGSSSAAEAQPFYVNSPFGIVLGHNGNLTNSAQLKQEMFRQDLRHINTSSDSEVLLNVLAHEIEHTAHSAVLNADMIFEAVAGVSRKVRGSISVSPSKRARTMSVSGAAAARAGSKLFGVLPLLQRNSCLAGGFDSA